MVKKIKKYLKFLVCVVLIMGLVAPSYAALSASDGSAFVTKAEFDSALADFNARLTTFEAGINSKIDSQVSSYLDRNGIWNGKEQTLENGFGDFFYKDVNLNDESRTIPDKYKYMLWYPSEVNSSFSSDDAVLLQNSWYGANAQIYATTPANSNTRTSGTYFHYYLPVDETDRAWFRGLNTGKKNRTNVIKSFTKTGLLCMTIQYNWECYHTGSLGTSASYSGLVAFKNKTKEQRDAIDVNNISYVNSVQAFWDIYTFVENTGNISMCSQLSEQYFLYTSSKTSPELTNDEDFRLEFANTVGSCMVDITQRNKKSTGLYPVGINQAMIFVQKGDSLWFDAGLFATGRFSDGLSTRGTGTTSRTGAASDGYSYGFRIIDPKIY